MVFIERQQNIHKRQQLPAKDSKKCTEDSKRLEKTAIGSKK